MVATLSQTRNGVKSSKGLYAGQVVKMVVGVGERIATPASLTLAWIALSVAREITLKSASLA
jgi:hypothetical protein